MLKGNAEQCETLFMAQRPLDPYPSSSRPSCAQCVLHPNSSHDYVSPVEE
jgi:hypothetical protein